MLAAGATRTAKAVVPVPVLGPVPVPVRRAQVLGLVEVGAAPQHTQRSRDVKGLTVHSVAGLFEMRH